VTIDLLEEEEEEEEEDLNDHKRGHKTDKIVTLKQVICWPKFVTRGRATGQGQTSIALCTQIPVKVA
jgi:hypothetical protein